MSSRKFRVFLAVLWILASGAAATGADVRATYGARTSADEPQYLLTAISLGEDRNLNIDDEIDSEAYLPFSEIGLNRQTRQLTPDKQVSPHDPLLPALLAIPVALGGWVGAKLFLAFVAGGVAAGIAWLTVRRFGVGEGTALLVCGVFGLSAPFSVYGTQVYPEIVAAASVVGAVCAVTSPRTPTKAVLGVTAVSALPWLSIKYVPVAAVLGLWLVLSLLRENRAAGVWVVAAFGASGTLFLAAHLAWYGGLTPYAVGDHFVHGEFTVVGTSPDLFGRSRRMIGLMVDDKFGLAAWQPAWLLLFPALGSVARRGSTEMRWLLAVLGAAWLNATFVALTMQGWWWPGRQLVVALPIAVLLICRWADAARSRLVAVALLGGWGIALFGSLVMEGLQGRVTWIVDFFEVRTPLYRVWQSVLPDYLDITWRTWFLHGIWLGIALGLFLWARTFGPPNTSGKGWLTKKLPTPMTPHAYGRTSRPG